MPDESGIAELDPFDLLDGEAARIDRFYSHLHGDQYNAPTRCEGWSRKDLLAHLAAGEDYTLAGLNDELQTLLGQAMGEGLEDLNAINELGVGRRAHMSATEVLEQWRSKSEEARRRLRERGRDGSLVTSVGPYPAGRQTFYLAAEYAIHADDAGVPITPDERSPRLDWMARFALTALEEYEKPVDVSLIEGGYVVRSEGLEAPLRIDEFVDAASARLPEHNPLDPKLREALVVFA